MAITKTVINGNMQTLHTAMQALVPDFFKAVSITGDSTYTITCTDADDNTLLTISGSSGNSNKTISVSIANGATYSSSSVAVANLFVTGSGAWIDLTLQSAHTAAVVIGKTNGGRTGVIFQVGMTSSEVGFYSAVWTANEMPAVTISNIQTGKDQTYMRPVFAFPPPGETMYFPDILMPDMTQLVPDGNNVPYEYTMGGVTYVTNMCLFLKDGGAS